MKIQFDTLDYQTDAVNSAVRVFEGQTIKESNFTITNDDPQGTLFANDGIGVGNRVIINEEQMLKNVNKTQILNGIVPSDNLFGNNKAFPQFNIEMETGTGKTFVYLKTILELNKQYGFLKFVIVVPSIAIKEGVLKTFKITKDYFKNQYNGVIYDLFMFDSSNPNRVLSFASANTIDIMVTTIQSFNKDTNVMNRENEQLSGARPIDLIAETRPIVIIDEPQSVDNSDLAKDALATLNSSAGFRYSATHRDNTYPKIYQLGAVDAYNNKLVKQIEAAGIEIDEDGNRAHLKLIEVKTGKNGITAKIEVYKKTRNDADKTILNFKEKDNMFTKTRLQVYDEVGFIQDIDATPGFESVTFSGNPEKITLESATLEDEATKRAQIAKTIEEHLNKELQFKKTGQRIKVLSLFFLDKVENYRVYDEEGNPSLGRYARIFEEEYERLIHLSKYKDLNDVNVPVSEVHDGYFSADNKGKLKNTKGDTQADESTYEMIMKNKEGLLTFYDEEKHHTAKANKIRFIFSHSALKEGWDNPNVFQIATLIETKDTITKRQKIGRGLRIAVNEDGERVPGFDVNTLTVMANESYKDFAEGLQKEYEEDGVIFGVFNKDSFATIIIKYDEVTEEMEILGKEKSEQLFNYLKQEEFINSSGRATDKLKQAITDKEIEVPEDFIEVVSQILDVARSKVKSLDIKDAKDKVEVKVVKEALADDFLELWNKIKYKTTYKIDFDSDKLIELAANGNESFDGVNSIQTRKGTYLYKKGMVEMSQAGVKADESSESSVRATTSGAYKLPDIITFLQNETSLTRKTIVAILQSVNNLDSFKNNPLSYMNQAAKIINAIKNQLIVDGIEYTRTSDEYEQTLFSTETLNAYLGEKGNSVKVDESKQKTVYDYVVTDSSIEKDFARKAEMDDNVKFYIKLPDWFKIRTPLGPYNPDWALLYEEDDEQHLYFIVETKGDTSFEQLRPHERAKILAGEKHFKAVDTDIKFKRVSDEAEIRG
ncbi:DEAD/DEAH box helicase family protein [Lactococcus lactis]|uniref:restriction endonuclease n=1 Tax=Lactococcus lactis TaxID=1358 RepID=UPI0022E05866|nr:DEAD/DEAH box helicase family protein [Lactococcus lactis]MDA2886741.1 DEAD/DEAH box helicase family protein [Lactococcus lactis]MDA2889160.1 DEAD/DEAH box helicase family protein [Lactococcus lactis]MDA2907871.1 DEAD/DEAH box helicase family protein [Lactococcus lactis]MEE0123485.1 DEAD/DEAH box helicase family protein [Streptococcus salivarius]